MFGLLPLLLWMTVRKRRGFLLLQEGTESTKDGGSFRVERLKPERHRRKHWYVRSEKK